jgi:hypothetical protein
VRSRLLFFGSLMALVLAVFGCAPNPLLGKWQIAQRQKEAEATYIDELTSNIRTSTGATQIEFRKDSILITGGTQNHEETGVEYSIQELPSGAIDVRILQPRPGDTVRDIDLAHVDSSGNSAQLESTTEIVNLTRLGQ